MIYSSVVATTNSNPSQVEITYASRDKASCVVQYTVCSGTSTRVLGVQGHDCSQAMATVDFQWWIIFIIVLAVLMVFSFGTAWAYPTSPRILVAAPNQQPQTSSPPPSERTGSSLTVYGVPVEADVPLATEIPNPGKSAVKTASEIV
ncbi:hypothetical protein BASA81_000316 [Batrachochytrium salamandrivorans]|nr:hypothetical protein BASA81_000316 [Batrachochytrium salamandrivorans]